MKTAFITGANGFVGVALTNHLLDRGWNVRAGVRRPGATSRPDDKAFKEIVIDGLGPDTDWRESLEGTDAVFHLAARVHHLAEDARGVEDAYQRVNHYGTKGLLDASEQAEVDRFVFLSSVKAVGESSLPGQCWDSQTQCRPMDAYGRSKHDAEIAVRASKVDSVILRIPLVFGPRVRGNMLRLLQAVADDKLLPLGMVKNRRSLIGLGNLVHAIHHVAVSPKAVNQTLFLSEPQPFSTPDLIKMIGDSLGRRPRLLKVPPFVFTALGLGGSFLEAILKRQMPISRHVVARLLGDLEIDSRPIREEIGWNPPKSSTEGIQEMADWFRLSREGLQA